MRRVLSSSASLVADIDVLNTSMVQMEAYRGNINELDVDLSASCSDRVKRMIQGELLSVKGMLQDLLNETHNFPTLVIIFLKPKPDCDNSQCCDK